MTTLLCNRSDARVFHATWQELLAILPYRDDGTKCDLLCVDTPYSERTHAGHDDGAAQANRMLDFASRAGGRAKDRRHAIAKAEYAGIHRRQLSYPPWTPDDVSRFVEQWAPVVGGWIVPLTDHVLAPAWERAMEDAGRYVFAPLACVESGSRVRLTGDGPSNWSCWAVVSRPRTARAAKWGTLPGAYVVPPGAREVGDGAQKDVVGGKPLWLLERLIEDYSRPGDLVVDPCCGAGTAIEAAVRTGRIGVGGDAMLEHAQIAARRVDRMVQRPLFAEVPR